MPGRTTSPRPSIAYWDFEVEGDSGRGKTSLMGASMDCATVTIMGLWVRVSMID